VTWRGRSKSCRGPDPARGPPVGIADLDNRLTDCGKVVSLTRPPSFTPRKNPGTHFCLRLSRPQGYSPSGRIRSIEKIHLVGTRTRDFPACSIVTQPTIGYRMPPVPAKLRNIKSYCDIFAQSKNSGARDYSRC
jgi:hypothetical protein